MSGSSFILLSAFSTLFIILMQRYFHRDFSTVTIWGQVILCRWELSCALRDVGSIRHLYPTAVTTIPPGVTTKTISRYYLMSPSRRSHPHLRTTCPDAYLLRLSMGGPRGEVRTIISSAPQVPGAMRHTSQVSSPLIFAKNSMRKGLVVIPILVRLS